jgi:hypothetical protein
VTTRTSKFRILMPLGVAAALVVAIPVFSQPTGSNAPTASTSADAHHARIQRHLQARLDRMADRLQITSAQQAAWTSYANTIQSLIGTNLTRPAADADAASITRFRAERAAERARKLSQLADATAVLQQTLDPAQRNTLDQIVRHTAHKTRHHRRRW